MKVLSGATTPDEGEMWLEGNPFRPANPREGRQHGVAMIYQELSLAPHLTVGENIFLGVEARRGPFVRRWYQRKHAHEALAQVARPDISPDVRVDRLSLADQQLVEIARSVVVGCKVLVLDEPTSSITNRDVENLFALIQRLKATGIAVIYISHFLEEIARISDRYTVLRDGKTVGTGMTSTASTEDIIQLMVGRQVEHLYPRSPRTAGEVVLDIEELSADPRPQRASMQLRRGEVFGIAGLIGSGRTELIRAVFGLSAVTSGRVRIVSNQSMEYQQTTPDQLWKRGVGMVSEDRKKEGLALRQPIANNLTLPRLSGLGWMGFVSPARQRAACLPWIDRLSIRCRGPMQPVGDLSGGNQQKVAIARLMHAACDVLLLDEPTRGIDVGSKAQIYQWIDRLVSVPGPDGKTKSVVVVSSYLPELLGICDRIAVMARGKLLPARAVGERDEHEIMMEATGANTGI
jgi:ribose transport system ATP-binding protein